MTTTKTGAFEAILAHHAALADGVARRAAALRARAAVGDGFEASSAELVAYLAGEVLPHANAEEATIYREAARRPELAGTVHQMLREHESLASLVERLAKAADAEAAVAETEAIQELFVGHVTKENERILPPLAADTSADLEGLLREMHRLTEHPGGAVPGRVDTTSDTEGELVRIVLAATTELADVGRSDRACRLAAEAWAMVRASRPDLAVRLTAALHGLARSITSAPVTFTAAPRSGASPLDAVLDVRALAPAQRHEKIFATYNVLGPGTGFVLVNDHDPKPLRYQFEAEHAGRFSWDELETGPSVWRVRIGRPTGSCEAAVMPQEAIGDPELDVRRFPHGQRHDVIFTTFDALAPGAGFELVNNHDPKPLRYQFEAQHKGRYTWDYLESGPQVWRVRIGRPE